MQVLVCLARAEGAVVSRDDLIRCCWGGRIVGEDAINHCVAKVRQIASTADAPAFAIETIARVGYRLKRSGFESDAAARGWPPIGANGGAPVATNGSAEAPPSAGPAYNGLVRGGFYASRAQRTEWAEAALDFARQGGELRPVATGPHACGAEALTKLERWEEGMAEAEYAVEAAPLVDSGYRARAHLEVARGAFSDALRDYAELEAREAGEDADEAYHVELAFLHLLAGNYDSAIRELRPWLVVDPRNSSAPFFLAAAQELSGHHDEAVAASRLYGRLKSDDGVWEMLAQSHEPAFLDAARTVRNALHDAGLNAPAD